VATGSSSVSAKELRFGAGRRRLAGARCWLVVHSRVDRAREGLVGSAPSTTTPPPPFIPACRSQLHRAHSVLVQVTVTCLEHGRLLQRLRSCIGGVFTEFKYILEMFLALNGFALATAEDIQEASEKQKDYHQVRLLPLRGAASMAAWRGLVCVFQMSLRPQAHLLGGVPFVGFGF
jgi:hypothetical protein